MVPSSKGEFYKNLEVTDGTKRAFTNQGGKYVGEGTGDIGPVRIRIEDAHKPTPGYNGPADNDHLIDHIHIEHRRNGVTGPWGSGVNNNISFPQSWLD